MDILVTRDIRVPVGDPKLAAIKIERFLIINPGEQAPLFAATTLDKQELKLEDLRGKVVLLDFWATWCTQCRKSRPLVEKVHQRFKDKGTVFFSINCLEKGGDPVAYLKRVGYTFTPLLNGNKMARSYVVKSLPAFVIVGKDGKIVLRTGGYSPNLDEQLAEVFETALAG